MKHPESTLGAVEYIQLKIFALLALSIPPPLVTVSVTIFKSFFFDKSSYFFYSYFNQIKSMKYQYIIPHSNRIYYLAKTTEAAPFVEYLKLFHDFSFNIITIILIITLTSYAVRIILYYTEYYLKINFKAGKNKNWTVTGKFYPFSILIIKKSFNVQFLGTRPTRHSQNFKFFFSRKNIPLQISKTNNSLDLMNI